MKEFTMTRTIVGILLILHAALLAWQGLRNSPTVDDVAHLPAGISHWKLGQFELYRVNPPLVRMLATIPQLIIEPDIDWSTYSDTPYSRPEFSIGASFARLNGTNGFWHITVARWACIPLSIVGAYSCYRWARELYGTTPGLIALTLWCFCPNILGNASLITPDAGAAALGITAGYTFWRWLRHPNAVRAFLAGLTLGAADLSKSTWVVLFGIWPLLGIIWRIFHPRTSTPRGSFKTILSIASGIPDAKSLRRDGHSIHDERAIGADIAAN